MNSESEPTFISIVESEDNYLYSAKEPDGEETYHLQIGNVTMHFFLEEWQSAIKFLEKVVAAAGNLAD